MESVQDEHGDDDHSPLEADKEALVPYKSARPALAQLGDAVNRSDEDAQGRQRQGDEEGAERGAGPQRGVFRVQGGVAAQCAHPPQRLDEEIETEELEEQEGEDLKGQPRHHDVVARVGASVLVAGDGCHAAANGLEEEGEDVAGDEDAGVRERFEVRVFRAEGDDDAGEGEVDTRGEEGGGNGQADDLHQETILCRLKI